MMIVVSQPRKIGQQTYHLSCEEGDDDDYEEEMMVEMTPLTGQATSVSHEEEQRFITPFLLVGNNIKEPIYAHLIRNRLIEAIRTSASFADDNRRSSVARRRRIMGFLFAATALTLSVMVLTPSFMFSAETTRLPSLAQQLQTVCIDFLSFNSVDACLNTDHTIKQLTDTDDDEYMLLMEDDYDDDDVVMMKGSNVASIPTELGLMTHFTSAHLQTWLPNSTRSSSIPTELGLLTKLTFLDVMWLHLTGIIPTELGQLTKLNTLSLNLGYRGSLSGTIPTELGQLTQLTRLLMVGMNVTGTLPTELGQLTQLRKLQMIRLDNLSGTIPSTLWWLTKLEQLRFWHSGGLGGEVSSDIGKLTGLYSLDLSATSIFGSIPSALCARKRKFASYMVDCANIVCGCCACRTLHTE